MNKFDELKISQKSNLREALKKMDKGASKILFAVDGNEKVLGTISDGDIRRYILKSGGLEGIVENIYSKNFHFAHENTPPEEIKKLMVSKKVESIPLLDDNSRLVSVIFWNEFFELETVDKPALNVPVIIMAGGKGTRLDPFTKILPKPLIPIGDRTILEIILDKFLAYHVNEFYLSINYKKNIIKAYLDDLDVKYPITYIEEDKPLGTVGSIKNLQHKLSGDIILTNCDIILDMDYSDVLKYHKAEKNDITMVASVKYHRIPYGVCEISNGGVLEKIDEKPEMHFLINTGMYVIKSDVLKYIPENATYHITQLIEEIKKQGHKVGVYPVNEKAWVDIGEWEEYRMALKKFI